MPIAVTAAKRSPQLPDLPTIGETIPGFATDLWYAVIAKGIPQDALEKLTGALRKIVASEKFKRRWPNGYRSLRARHQNSPRRSSATASNWARSSRKPASVANSLQRRAPARGGRFNA